MTRSDHTWYSLRPFGARFPHPKVFVLGFADAVALFTPIYVLFSQLWDMLQLSDRLLPIGVVALSGLLWLLFQLWSVPVISSVFRWETLDRTRFWFAVDYWAELGMRQTFFIVMFLLASAWSSGLSILIVAWASGR